MESYLNNKKINTALFVFLIIISLFVLSKFVNEIRSSKYIGKSSQIVNTISVDGKGEVIAVSDIASLYINLTKDGATAKEAQNLLNESITKTLNYLKEQKIEEKDIKSEYGGLTPKYSYEQPVCYTYPCPSKDPKIIGYTATQSIIVKVREVDNANIIRTGLATIGITNISGPTFSIDNEDSFKEEARSLAIKEAKKKAQVLANELGLKLGKIVSFYENSNRPYPMMNEAMLSSRMDTKEFISPAPELPKGENKIISNVTITYEIR